LFPNLSGITFTMIIGFGFIVREPTRSVSSFGSIDSGIVASLDRVHRDETLCARWNAHRNERLTWVSVESKMPMEPRFERGRQTVDRCFVAFPRYLTETRCVLSIGYTFPGCSSFWAPPPERLKVSFAPVFARRASWKRDTKSRPGVEFYVGGIRRLLKARLGGDRKLSRILSIAIS